MAVGLVGREGKKKNFIASVISRIENQMVKGLDKDIELEDEREDIVRKKEIIDKTYSIENNVDVENILGRIHNILKKPFFYVAQRQFKQITELIENVDGKFMTLISSSPEMKKPGGELVDKKSLVREFYDILFSPIGENGNFSNIMEFKAFENNLIFLIRLYKAGVTDASEVAKYYGVKKKEVKEVFGYIEKICGRSARKGYIPSDVLIRVFDKAKIFDMTEEIHKKYKRMQEILPQIKEEIEKQSPGLYSETVKVLEVLGREVGLTLQFPQTVDEYYKKTGDSITEEVFKRYTEYMVQYLMQVMEKDPRFREGQNKEVLTSLVDIIKGFPNAVKTGEEIKEEEKEEVEIKEGSENDINRKSTKATRFFRNM